MKALRHTPAAPSRWAAAPLVSARPPWHYGDMIRIALFVDRINDEGIGVAKIRDCVSCPRHPDPDPDPGCFVDGSPARRMELICSGAKLLGAGRFLTVVR
jgi:hypothetical protein